MKTDHALLAALSAAMLAACTPGAESNANSSTVQPEPQRPAMVGGWSAGVIDAESRAAAQFAVTTMNQPGITLTSLDAVGQQVVAGRNYRLDLTLSDGSRVRATVWKKLDGSFELTNISPIISPAG
jgi:uncharacterized lipoprotein YajG